MQYNNRRGDWSNKIGDKYDLIQMCIDKGYTLKNTIKHLTNRRFNNKKQNSNKK